MSDVKVHRGRRPNIPRRKIGPRYKYPFAEMEVGDWFEVPNSTYQTLYSCARAFVSRYAPHQKYKIIRMPNDAIYVERIE